jgi:site-specific DNA-cytosine methylase
MRAGLDAAGWQCVQAVDNDPDAIAIHRLAHGDARDADVTALSIDDLPQADVWVAGFPCQPFSSSGTRLGFGHRAGNVFEHVARLMEARRPQIVLLENVEGLLSNKSGHTMAAMLAHLADLGYSVSWLLLNLCWYGVPQTRARLFVIAAQPGVIRSPRLADCPGSLPGLGASPANAFATLLDSERVSWTERCRGGLRETEQRLRPAVGKPKPTGRYAFGPLGHCEGDAFCSFDLSASSTAVDPNALGAIVAPAFNKPELIRSLRFWTTDAGRGPTKLWIRPKPISHCIGTSLGGAPLFGVPLASVRRSSDRASFLEFANWHREQDGLLVMRLSPSRAVLLFGPHTERLRDALESWDAGDTRKYKVVGNMVAPICAKSVAELISGQVVPAGSAKQIRSRTQVETGPR